MVIIFLSVWSLGALGIGALFAFRPEIPADMYIAQADSIRGVRRLRRRLAPRARILVWYRIGGVFFMVMGVVMPVLALTGVLPLDEV
ncbi:hypothetical protein [Microbacterium sp. NPDC089696]|uniref:hypothetical protein n=1 Tax=Microbacterium sp. NPDC089696 TaxID=3364199 RepID=UPI0038214A94